MSRSVAFMRAVHLAAMALVGLALALTVVAVVGGWRLIPVTSSTMQPSYGAGSLVLAKPVAAKSVRPHDVIAYVSPIDGHPLVMRRVVAVDHTNGAAIATTKADANAAVDVWTTNLNESEALTPIAAVPHLGTAWMWLQQFGMALLVMLALGVALYMRSSAKSNGTLVRPLADPPTPITILDLR